MSENLANNEEKKMTKYDRKMEARKQQAAKEKRNQMRTRLIAIVAVLVVVAAVLFTAVSSSLAKRSALNDAYIKVGEHEVTRVEYDYYYWYMVNNYLTQYSYFLQYMGLDTSVDFAEQQYSENMTWKDFFDQMTVTQIQQVKAVSDEVKATGWEYDVTEEYEELLNELEKGAVTAGSDVENYYKALYGEYATAENVKPFIEENLLTTAYSEHMYETFAPAEDEITAYYEEHKDEYDLVDYYEAVFNAEVAEDAGEDDIKTAMVAVKEQADAMKSRLEAGEDFEDLCVEYLGATAEEETEEESEEETKDAHLHSGYSSSYVTSLSREWMFDADRKSGDVTVVEDADNNRYYVLKFVERKYDEDCEETISDVLATEDMTAYLEDLVEPYKVTDLKANLVYLTLPEETVEEDAE